LTPSQKAGSRPMKIAVSIINYKTVDLTLSCVQSVMADRASPDAPETEIIVVDNLSNDGSVETLRAWIAQNAPNGGVTLVESNSNSGFSGGHNQGIQAAKADAYLVLNSDAVIRPGFLAAMARAAAETPAAGMFGPRIEHENGEQAVSCFRAHNIASEVIRGAIFGPVTRLLSRFDVPLQMPPKPDQIAWASFACILIRADVIAQIGPMDEGYFLYFEDVEYSLRAGNVGWSIAYVPDASAMHMRGGSGPVASLKAARKRLPKYFYVSRSRMYYQIGGRPYLLAANLGWYLGRLLSFGRLLTGKPRVPANGNEARDIWIGFGDPMHPYRPEGNTP
jgi:N-acetylglucosaminyl-diphospho-decaprenol L-rhamnosyltransferase